MLNFAVTRRFPFIRISDEARREKIAALEADIVDLRSRLVSAQNAKAQSIKQADELRKEKDRLRTTVAAQKKANDSLQRVNDNLRAKIGSIQEECDLLHRKLEDTRSEKSP